ncbi:MAG TPA: hypothetical protein VM240_01910 [Verrucomicrobiae bacterium]|nr:hypothetical protein [Verrucomicrobiae bacterium]
MSGLGQRFGLWLAAMVALALVYGFGVHGRMRVETDLLAMLPQVERDALVESAVRALSDATGRRTLFLAGAPDAARARAAAEDLAARLRDSGAFSAVTLRIALDDGALDALYGTRRAALLSGTHRAWLREGAAARLGDDALRALYTPSGWLRARPFAEDPLNLYGDFLAQLLPAAGKVHLQDSLLVAPSPQGPYVLVAAETAATAFTLAGNARLEQVIAESIAGTEQAHAGAEVLCSGVVRYAAAAAASGTAEIATFGSISTAAIVLLVLLTFRGPRPLLLTLTSLAVGALAALTACHFLFDRVHLITLVFGSTLTGVAVDYSIHYFADQFRQRGEWDPRATLHHVGPAILVGMLATALGYLALVLLPFPGLRQMAVFSIVGIGAACATVLLAYPFLANRRAAAHRPAALALSAQLARIGTPKVSSGSALAALVAALAFTAFGLSRLVFVDDVRALQSTPEWLKAEDARVRELLGGGQDTRFFLIEGPDAEALLQAEERLREGLDALVARGALGGYQAVSRALPSLARQRENHAWLAAQVYSADGVLARTLADAGYAEPDIRARLQAFPREAPGLTPDEWLASSVSAPLRNQWLAAEGLAHGRGVASVVSLAGVNDLAALQALAQQDGVTFVDRVARISQVMQRFRKLAGAGLAAAFAVVTGALMLRYGAAGGARLIVAPLGGAMLTLATLGAAGVEANLFNVLALLLVLGMGVDYAVFMREGRGARSTVIMAIVLAGLMTLLSFGLLALSTTPFIRSLGLTVVLGVTFTFLLALLASGGDNAALARPPGHPR